LININKHVLYNLTQIFGKLQMDIMLSSLSLRTKSLNLNLIKIVAQVVKNHQHTAKIVDLNAYQMPYYNQEIQDAGAPVSVLALKEHMDKAGAIMLASPEYNFSMPGHFKNTLDWLSRCKPSPFSNKPILLLSASPAMAGGNRGLWALRVPLEACGAFVYPNMFSLAVAHEAFTEQGTLKDASLLAKIDELVISFLKFASVLAV
jgi:chromate reductase